MTLTEQKLFEDTRDRIQHNLSQLSALARAGGGAAFFPRFLELACDSLNAAGAAFWLADAGGMRRIAERAFPTSAYDSDPRQKLWVDAVLSATVSAKRPHIVAADEPGSAGRDLAEGTIGNAVPHPFFYHPVLLGEQVGGVLQIWLPQAGDPRTYNDISTFIAQLCQHAETYLRGWQANQLAAKNDQAQAMLRMQSELVGELDPRILEASAANYLVDLLRADLACIFLKKGKSWTLAAASNQEVVDAKAVHSQAFSAIAQVLPAAPAGAVCAASPGDGPHQAAMVEAGLLLAGWCHLSSSKNASQDVLIFAAKNSEGNFPPNAQELLAWAAGQLARALDPATHFHHIPLRQVASLAGRTLRAWNQNRRKKVFAWIIAPVAVAALVLLMPVTWKISTQCTVMPSRKAVVVTETSGKITGVEVGEGDAVVAGQVLARMDDTDYRTQLAVSHQQQMRWQVEAGKAQSLGNEAERKIAELGAAREAEAIRRIEFLRARTRLTSPIDGIVLTRNLHNREGEALETGKPFCEIAGRDGYELLLDIEQKDLGDLLSALEAKEQLPVGFILHPHPHTSLRATLSGPEHVSQIPELKKTGSVFIARVPFPPGSPLDGVLKPGFTGKAKIEMGRRPLGWVLTRPFLNYLRIHWGV